MVGGSTRVGAISIPRKVDPESKGATNSKDSTPHTAEDVAFVVGRFFQYGGTFQNYYMARVYSYAGNSVCFFGNAHPSMDVNINFQNTQ
ncbi:hypothetical protein JHK85_046142 [Glycine max]|nr:hypothetical protein JHK85_046142 [Glycine max]